MPAVPPRDIDEAGLPGKKAALARLLAAAPDALANFEQTHDVELTYTSNALEGNTLTAVETALVLEKGITIGGKPLKDHLEAIDHAEALAYVRDLARHETPVTEVDLRSLHRLVMLRSAPTIAGRYAIHGRYVHAGRHAFPSPAEIPAQMAAYIAELRDAPLTPAAAYTAHRRLVDIHPFDDGNGRTARLLMNLLLLRAGYPPIAIGPADRLAYLDALQQAQAGHGPTAFDRLMQARLAATLDAYLDAARAALPPP